MGIIDKVSRFISGAKQKLYTTSWFLNFLNEANREDSSSSAIKDPYKEHDWFNIGVKKIAENIARAPFKVSFREEEELGEVSELFNFVNTEMSKYQLFEATAAWLYTEGEAFWTFGTDYSTGLPKKIVVTNPRRMKHRLSESEDGIVLWTYEHNEKTIVYQPDEVIHFKFWNPWDEWRGVNPVIAQMAGMGADKIADRNNFRLLENNSVIPGILSSEHRLTDDQVKEIRKGWRKRHSVSSNNYQNDVAVLGEGTSYTPIGLKPTDMEYISGKKWSREAVLAALGVPPGVCGFSGENTPLSGEEKTASLKAFWELTLIPLQTFIEDKLRTDFFSRYLRVGYSGAFDRSEITELREDEDRKTDRMLKEVATGCRTINNYREAKGEDPVPWGDTWYKPINLVPVDYNPVPAPPPQEGKGVDRLLKKSKTKSLYTATYRNKHWWEFVNEWENIEDKYKKSLQAWFKGQRSDILSTFYSTQKNASFDGVKDRYDDLFWTEQLSELKQISSKYFLQVFESVGSQMEELFTDLKIGRTFNIYDSRAITLLENRVNKGSLENITDTMRKQVRDSIQAGIEGGFTEDEFADAVRAVYNRAGNRAATIARTELAGVVNDSRQESFKNVGFEKHSWLSAQDGKVRDGHGIDGEIKKIGEAFSNGLLYPGDPAGDAGDVINCRCLTLPEEN